MDAILRITYNQSTRCIQVVDFKGIRPPQIQINPLVEGGRVAVTTGLPVTGHTRFHQQPLPLVVVVGCHLVRQRGGGPTTLIPFVKMKNTKDADKLDYWLDLQVFVLPMALRTAYRTSESQLPLCV